MNINNLNNILPILKWDNEDHFYFVQILKRKKENPDLGRNATVIATYYIYSENSLIEKMEEMIILANYHKARIYIDLNRRSAEQLALKMLTKVVNLIENKNYKDVKTAYASVAGNFHIEKANKKWVVDIDNVEDFLTYKELILQNIISVGGFLYTELKTLNGVHFITSPFNVQEFNKKCLDQNIIIPDIQKNNPTILYA